MLNANMNVIEKLNIPNKLKLRLVPPPMVATTPPPPTINEKTDNLQKSMDCKTL